MYVQITGPEIETPDCEAIARYPLTEDEWHELRRLGIGGSDAGVIMGYSKYRSPLSLWMLKTGRMEDEGGDSEAAEMGTLLEPFIRRELVRDYIITKGYAEDVEVVAPWAMYRSTEQPFMMANVDGFLVFGDEEAVGLEIKTGNSYQLQHWGGREGDEVPDVYYAQVQHYMAVTGLSEWWIFGVIGNQRLLRIVPRNQGYIADLVADEEQFWRKVQSNDPLQAPLPQGTDSDMDALMALGSPQVEDTADISEVEDAIQRYADLGEELKDKKEEREAAKQRIIAALGNAKYGESDGYRVTFSRFERSSIDSKRLKKERPEVAAEYTTTSESGRLTVKGV